ncbi:microsomal triglyceride transfer protein large subunit [Elysia marginata]|uniref:Microsomal triglyceride transfer protein large subunit n=1 Tax=Elysia marginata TaxID=1093978 RepID=A0AAV4IMP4_9GAST|nr:microsomal triglyceride transfer protein large subunit [Elysia marginata]
MEPRLLALLALASVAIAGPITVTETNSCATECPASTKLTYAPGTTYVYDYRVDYSTSMSGASEDSAKLTLTTTAELEVLGPCEMALSLKDTRLFHSDAMGGLKAADKEETFRRGLEGSALRFSYQDGVVDHVCAGNREEPWALNIKKGILSAFQNSMDDLSKAQNLTETDVMGTCETQYETVSNGYYSNSVKKTKNILTCTDRHDYRSLLQMVPYNVPSELQSIPLMKTTHECDQVIQKGGVLQSTTCTETHVYRPFSNDKSGGATSVTQTLTYKTYSRGVSSRQDTISSRDSLLFDHSASRPSASQARQQVEQKLKEICESTSYAVRPESPRLFSELVYALKALDKLTMDEVFRQLKTKTLCPSNNKAYKMFLDALPMVSSSASVSLMTSLITNEDVEGLHAKAWIASLALINAPTSEMLLDAKALIDSDKLREDALLPVSSMVNNFCFKSSACDQSYAVLSIMASLERNIGSRCDASRKDFQEILLTLRAIGNAGHASRAVPVIAKCLTNSRNPLEIRVAAANAFRRMPCDAEETHLWNTYENSELDSELRIAAYQALMRCPSDATLGKMAASLGGELDEQVGAYVYSHMTNLKQTSDPHKQMVARALDNLVIPSKYESNPMKASSNMEASALINKINTGFVAESNLVWSNNAQVPRSASANLTVELFGQSINLVDFGGRVEGLEHLIKNLFGPYLGEEEAKKAKSISYDNIHGSVYGRVFGNEMLFVHSKQVSSSLDKVSFKWLDMLINLAQKQEVAFTHARQFMDASMIIPTAAGLPIHINVNGSAVVDVLLSGKADLRKLSSSPRSLDIDGEIRPSAAMEITGTMAVDAFVTKTGLRMRNTMHTSTSLKGRIQMERGQQLSIELDTPRDKMEIFDARSKFFILHNNVEQEQKMITENRKEFELCTCAKTAEITGAVLCGQISFPNASMQSEGPYFPLTGPSSASLVLRKTDTHSGYKLLAKRVENKKMSVAQISFNTPGSKVNRVILIDMTMNYPRQSLDAQVVSPWKKAAIAGALVNKKDMKSLSGSITIDESDIYAWTSEVKVSKSKGKVQYSPMVEIRQPGMDTVQMTGFVSIVNGMKSLDVDLSLIGLQKLPYNLKVAASNTKKERSIKASVSEDGGKSQYSMEASNRFSIMGKKAMILTTSNMLKVNTPKKEIFSMKTSADYKEDKSLKLSGAFDIDRVMKKPVLLKLSMVKNAKKRGVRYDVDGNVKSTVFTGRLDSNMFIKTSGLVSTKTAVDYNIPKVAKNKIVLSGKFNDRSTKAYTKYILKSNLDVKKNPEYNVGLNFGFDHKKKHTEAELEVRYGANRKDKTKTLYLNTAINRKIPNYKNAVLVYKMKAQAPEHKINLLLAGKHTHNPKMIDSDVKLTYAKNKAVSASLLLKDKTGKAANINGRASVAWPGSEYILSSKLDRKPTKLTHEITMKGSNGMKHSIDTVYKKSNSDNHVFSSVFNLQGLKKTTISGSANMQSKNMQVSGEVKYGKDTYGVSTKAKQSKLPGGILIVEAFYPDRRVIVKLDGEKARNKLEGNIETSWDADNDKSKKITLGGSVYNKQSRKAVSLGGDVSFTSPFDRFEKLAGTFKYGSDSSQHDIAGKLSWGGKSKQIMSSLSMKKPISLSHLVASIEAKTPFRMMRSASAEIAHTWENTLSTIVKGNLNKENAKLIIEGEGSMENMKGSVSLASTIKNAEDISATFSHRSDPGKVSSSAVAMHNGKSYGYNLDMGHRINGWKINTNGDLMITMPKSKVSTTWLHKNDENMVKSQVSSKWGKKKLNVILSGSRDSLKNIDGELKIDSPWKSVGDVVASLNHKHGNGFIKSSLKVVQDGSTEVFSTIKYSHQGKNMNLDFTITPLFIEDISGKLNAKYDAYPMTSTGELQWHPGRKITAETSINAEKWDNAAFDLKVTTPVRGYRNINMRASNRKEGGEMISHANLDYGARRNIDIETRHALEGRNKMARMKISTPFEKVKSLDTGLRFDGHATNFDSSADFEMVPLVGKFQGSAKFNYDDDMTGTVRLDTPYPEYPYFELFASSNGKGRVRKSRVEARLHPRQVYSADATYSFELPISFEANINSPHPEYDNLGLVFQHNHSPSSIASHGEVRYQPDKKIEGDLNADWSSKVEGSLLVKTPFPGYEISKVALRHQGDLKDFSTHGEMNVAEKSIVADANFKAGHTTTGTFTLLSPIPGMENVELNLKKKGRAKNFRGEMTLTVNDKKIDADYNHRLIKDGLKSSFKLTTPYTENIRVSLEHNGKAQKFTNEISANYGRRYDVDTVVSFDYNEPDVAGHGMIKYKLGGRRQTAQLHMNKNGALNDMSFSGSAGVNDDEINVSGSWKNRGSMEGNVKVNTPFRGFKSTGLSISHDGHLNDFRSSLDLTYMDNKNINGKIALATRGLRVIRLDSEIATTFKKFPSASLIFNHNYDDYRNVLNGDISLTTPAARFGSGSLTYTKTGSMDNLDVVTIAKRNGREVGSFKLANTMTGQEMHSSLQADVSEYPALAVNFDHMGDLSNFNTVASGSLGRDSVSGEVYRRGPLEDLTVGGTAKYNNDAVEVTGTWNSQRGLDGNLNIKTPFDDFNDVGMSFTLNGEPSDFSSSAKVEFMDNKVISGKIDVNTDGRFVSEVNTPFEGFEYSKVEANGAYDSYSGDINTKVILTSRINDFGTGEASFSKYGDLDNLVVDGSILRNNVELGSVKLTNSRTSDELRTAFNGKISELPEVSLTLDHTGDLASFNTKAHASIGDNNVAEAEATFKNMGSKVTADANLMYNTERYGSNQGSLSLTKAGEIDDFNVRMTGKLNDQESTVSGEMKMKDEITGSLSINTPLRGYNNVGVSFKHMGTPSRFNSEGQINLVDGEQYSAKVNFYRNKYRLIEANVEVNTPIRNAEFTKLEYRHEGQRDSFKCYAALEYGQSQKITYDMSASTSPNVDFSVALKTPFENYETMMASATVETQWPQVAIVSNVNAGNGNLVALRGSLDASKDVSGSINLNTPVEGFSDVGLSFEHVGKLKNFKSEGRITYMDGKEISGKAIFKQWRQYAFAELRTPFSGLEYTEYEWSKKDTDTESITETHLVYGNGKVSSSKTVITFKPRPGFSITIKSPTEGYEEMMASASYDNSWPKFELNSQAKVGRKTQFSMDASFDATNDISGSVAMKTPIDGFKDIGMSFSHAGNSQKFDCEGKVTYMDGQDISGKVSFYKYMWRRVAASAELSTPFRGARSTKAEINYEDNSISISATAALEYGRKQKIDGNLKLTYSPSYDALLTINTPFYDYRTIRAQGSLDITSPSYSAGYSINYGYNTVYSASGKLNLYSVDNVDGSLEIVLPIQGIEYTKADYQHKYDSSRVDGSMSLTYGNSKTISGELKASMMPNYDVNVMIKTPFEGYEIVQGSANYDSGYNNYGGSSSFSLGSTYTFSVVSSLDLSAEPFRASTQISTPFNDFRNMELVITHEGSINDFRCTGFLSTPITDNINAAANMRYNSLIDMEGSASVKSTFDGMDDLLAEIKTSDVSGEKKVHALVGWTRGKQISADTLFRQKESWYENKVYGEMSVATPFDVVRSLAVQGEHSGKQEENNQMFSLELNGEKLLDFDTEYSSKNKHQGSITFRKPLPMQYSVSASSNAGITETEVVANWNRDEMDSNVHITASVNDQSDSYKTERIVDIALEYASRKMGVVHKLSSTDPLTTSFGKLYWDSDDHSRIYYDMQVTDNSRRRKEVKEGHFTVGLPHRTLGLSGSYSDNRVVKSGDATFSWDSDRDDSQVGIKGTMTRGDRIKGDITLSMPAIRKEIRLDGELMSQNGRIILDARTDISYSKDSRKTLTLVSKLEDISDYYSHYNYSLAVGVSHPYTNVDIQMTSHLGCSEEKMTIGLSTDYLTARKQNKNLGLLAQINKLKRQLNLQITNPTNKMEIAGGVVSMRPYKVNMFNKVDDVEIFRSDLTLDEDKKSIEINLFEGSEGLKLSAGYPNLKQFRGEISRMSYGRETTQALLAVRLNTTRLMHTRLHWDPKMADNVWQAVGSRAKVESIKAAEVLSELNSAFAEELAGKYTDITGALQEELKPLVDELEKEMKVVAREMYKLSKEMRKAYESNAFHVQDMGQSATEAYMRAQEQLTSLTREYRKASTEIIQSLSQGLQKMTAFPIKEHYSEMVNSATTWLNENFHKALSSLESYLAKADAALTEYHNTITELRDNAKNSVYNATYVTYISDRLNAIDVSSYIPSLEIPEDYTNAIYNVHNAINTKVGHMLDAPGLRYVKGGLNEVYQQGVWAYNFWQVEENIQAHAKRVLMLIREIVEDELKEYAEDLQGLYQNPITVWLPDSGEVQAEFRLPMEVSRLDEMPDFTPLMNQISAKMPDTSALENISETLSDLWEATEEDDEISKELKKYRPSKKMRKAKKGRKYRARRPRN